MSQTFSSTGRRQPFMRSTSSRSIEVPVAVDEQDDGQAHADLGGGDGDDEQGEDLAGDGSGVVPQGAEGDQVDVDGVEDQLDRHEHEHAVPAGEHAVDADAEQDGAEEQELVERTSAQSLLARTMAPTRAASRSTDTTSKGMR